jgi:hypothetical protein
MSEPSAADSPELVWRLRGSTVRDVQCWITATSPSLFAVRVIHNHETMLEEMYPDAKTAMARANRLRSDLVKTGWSVISE